MAISNCVLVFLVLFVASLVMQFRRAKKRQGLVRQIDQKWLSPGDQEKWKSVNEGFDLMFKDFRKIQIVKKNVALLPENLVIELDRYKIFSKLEILVTACMLLFAAFAFYLCN